MKEHRADKEKMNGLLNYKKYELEEEEEVVEVEKLPDDRQHRQKLVEK